MHELPDEKLTGLVIEETGASHDSTPVKCAVSCIKHLKKFADFSLLSNDSGTPSEPQKLPYKGAQEREGHSSRAESRTFGLNLGYTINLNLPATTDQAVFNAIFKSLKENLLSKDDG